MMSTDIIVSKINAAYKMQDQTALKEALFKFAHLTIDEQCAVICNDRISRAAIAAWVVHTQPIMCFQEKHGTDYFEAFMQTAGVAADLLIGTTPQRVCFAYDTMQRLLDDIEKESKIPSFDLLETYLSSTK